MSEGRDGFCPTAAGKRETSVITPEKNCAHFLFLEYRLPPFIFAKRFRGLNRVTHFLHSFVVADCVRGTEQVALANRQRA